MADLAAGAFITTEEFTRGREGRRHGSDDAEAGSGHHPVHDDDRSGRSRRPATREKVNWLEEQYVNTVVTVTAGGYTAGAVSLTLSAADAPVGRRTRTSSAT